LSAKSAVRIPKTLREFIERTCGVRQHQRGQFFFAGAPPAMRM
jgi:hypothetical protein